MLYDNIKRAAKEKGVAIYKLEDELKFSRGSICKWNDVEPSINKVYAVAKYLGKPIEYFLQ